MGLPALLDDYLFLGPLICQRLKDRIADVPVEMIERPEQVFDEDQRQAVLMVLWAGDVFPAGEGSRSGGGTSQAFEQRWLVILGLRNVGVGKAARVVGAGPLLSRIHKALAGWEPKPHCPRPLARANAPLKPDFTKSKALFPLGFAVTLNL